MDLSRPPFDVRVSESGQIMYLILHEDCPVEHIEILPTKRPVTTNIGTACSDAYAKDHGLDSTPFDSQLSIEQIKETSIQREARLTANLHYGPALDETQYTQAAQECLPDDSSSQKHWDRYIPRSPQLVYSQPPTQPISQRPTQPISESSQSPIQPVPSQSPTQAVEFDEIDTPVGSSQMAKKRPRHGEGIMAGEKQTCKRPRTEPICSAFLKAVAEAAVENGIDIPADITAAILYSSS